MVVAAVKVTAEEVPFFSVTTCAVAGVPTVVDGNVNELGVMVSPVLEATPVPETATVCGVVEAESLNVMVADNAPAPVGVKVKVLVQLAPAASGFAQVEAVLENELAPVPVMVVAAVKVTDEDVLFFSVTTCAVAGVPTAVDGNVSDDGVIVRPAPLVPVPERLTVCGDPAAVSL
jgi:malate/lactate dehydrogenase